MKLTLTSNLLAIAALSNLVQAGGGGGDKTFWYTTTCWETKYPDQEPPKTYYSTVYVPTEVTKYQPVPTTVYQNVPTTVYQNVPTTVYLTQVNEETVYQQNTVTQVATQVATQVQATTIAQTVTVTVTNAVPTTITSVQSGLVLCPTRIVNPTYTPSTQLPSTYLWGCPPGSICQPTKENCNFERGPPADTYYCPPEQCQIAGPLPPLQSIIDQVDAGDNCAWLTPDPGYFDLDPTAFGKSYAIFNIFGQAQCPAQCPAPSTVTVTETAPGQAPPPVTVTAPGQAPPQATVTVTVTVTVSIAPPPAPPSSTWQTWSEPATPSPSTWAQWSSPAPVASSTWQGWEKGSATQSHGGKITPRAALDRRVTYFQKPCYKLANYAQKVVESIGSNSVELCPAASPFSAAYSTAINCYSSNGGVIPSAVVTLIESAVTFCSQNAKRSAEVQFSPRRNRRVQDGAL